MLSTNKKKVPQTKLSAQTKFSVPIVLYYVTFNVTRVGISLFHSSLFCSKSLIQRATVSDSLTSIFTKEQPWAIRSHPSLQKRECEQFAHIPLYKRVTVSNLLFKKEWPWAIRSHPSLQKSNHERFAHIPLYKRVNVSDLLTSLFTKERLWAISSLKKSYHERFAGLGTHSFQKNATFLRSL